MKILYSVGRASLYTLVNETSLVHLVFLACFINFIYNLYMFQTSQGPSSGGTTVLYVTLDTCVLYSLLSWYAHQTVSYTE